MSEFRVILTTCPKMEQAKAIAKALVDNKLAACVQISQAVSAFYQWQNETVEDTEHQMVIKTQRRKVDQIHKLLLSMHPYDVPQFIVLDAVSGSQQYLDWMESSL